MQVLVDADSERMTSILHKSKSVAEPWRDYDLAAAHMSGIRNMVSTNSPLMPGSQYAKNARSIRRSKGSDPDLIFHMGLQYSTDMLSMATLLHHVGSGTLGTMPGADLLEAYAQAQESTRKSKKDLKSKSSKKKGIGVHKADNDKDKDKDMDMDKDKAGAVSVSGADANVASAVAGEAVAAAAEQKQKHVKTVEFYCLDRYFLFTIGRAWEGHSWSQLYSLGSEIWRTFTALLDADNDSDGLGLSAQAERTLAMAPYRLEYDFPPSLPPSLSLSLPPSLTMFLANLFLFLPRTLTNRLSRYSRYSLYSHYY